MADSAGYQVAASELNDFAGFLDDTTVSEINTAAQGVASANKADINAFGIALGQSMGIPCRIAMGVVADNVKKLSDKVSSDAKNTRDTATQYSQNETSVATSFDNVLGA
jgi:hypothetical protein